MSLRIDLLPPHVVALIFRDATIPELTNVTHVCRALHALLSSQERCACAHQRFPPSLRDVGPRTLAFWTHWKAARNALRVMDLCTYASRGSTLCVHYALWCGVEANVSNATALSLACRAGRTRNVQRILDGPIGRWQDVVDTFFVAGSVAGYALDPFVAASAEGHAHIIELLLRDPRLDPRIGHPHHRLWTDEAIEIASSRGHVHVLRVLLRDSRCDPSPNVGRSALESASCNGRANIVRLLLRAPNVDPTEYGHHIMIGACREGHANVVDAWLRDGRADPCAQKHALLREAVRRDDAKLVSRILADPRVAVRAPLLQRWIKMAHRNKQMRIAGLLQAHLHRKRFRNARRHERSS